MMIPDKIYMFRNTLAILALFFLVSCEAENPTINTEEEVAQEESEPVDETPAEVDPCDNLPSIRIQQVGADITEPYLGSGFGNAIALNGDGTRIVVGSPFDDTNGTIAGKVSIYEYVNDTWQKLGADILGKGEYNNSGLHVAINKEGNMIGFTGLSDGAHGRVYRFDGGTWTQMGGDIITPEDETGANAGGISMNDEGNRVVFGASTYQPVAEGLKRGGARVYQFLGDSWQQIGQTMWIEDCTNCLFAGGDHEVSISGDGKRVALGASYRPPNSVRYSYVNVFEYNNTDWGLVASSGGRGTTQRSRVSLNTDGTRMTLSALSNGWTGSIGLLEVGSDITTIDVDYSSFNTSFFGIYHSINGDGDRFVVHEPLISANGGNNNGVTRLYFQLENSICQVKVIEGSLRIDNTVPGFWDEGGVSMSADGKRFAVSSYKVIGNEFDGIAKVYEIIEE